MSSALPSQRPVSKQNGRESAVSAAVDIPQGRSDQKSKHKHKRKKKSKKIEEEPEEPQPESPPPPPPGALLSNKSLQ